MPDGRSEHVHFHDSMYIPSQMKNKNKSLKGHIS